MGNFHPTQGSYVNRHSDVKLAMTLGEKLFVYETVIQALKNQTEMTEVLSKFPISQQLEAIRFMEFMEGYQTPPTDSNTDLQ